MSRSFQVFKIITPAGNIFKTAQTPLNGTNPKESNNLSNMLTYKYLTLSGLSNSCNFPKCCNENLHALSLDHYHNFIMKME